MKFLIFVILLFLGIKYLSRINSIKYHLKSLFLNIKKLIKK